MRATAEAIVDAELGALLLDATDRAAEQEAQDRDDLRDWGSPATWCSRHGAQLWGGQERILEAVAEHDRVAIPGGHGLGKGHVTAWLARWWLARPASRVLLTGNTNSQVKLNTWHELSICHQRYGWPGDLMAEEWRFPGDPARQAFRMTTSDGDAFQGKHAPRFLVVFDEAAGDRLDTLWGAGRGSEGVLRTLITKRGGKIVCIGNPTRRVGAFARMLKGEFEFHVERITSTEAADWQLEHGEVPGLVDWPTIEKWARDCGFRGEGVVELRAWLSDEGERNDWIRPRVLGLVPMGEGGGLFPAELLEDARSRSGEPAGPMIVGIDVARKGGDQTIIAVRRGQSVHFALTLPGLDHATQLTRIEEWLKERQRAHDEDEGPAIETIRVDATGEGSALPDMLAARGWPAERVHFGGKAKRPDKFKNRRAEGYRALKTWLSNGGTIPDDDYLVEELEHVEPIPGGVSGIGGATVEALPKKDDIRELIGRSPDRADAVVLTVMPEVEPEPEVSVW